MGAKEGRLKNVCGTPALVDDQMKIPPGPRRHLI